MKYKVGDKVRIKSIDWYNDNKNNKGVIVCGSELFTHPMSHFCNKVVNIITIQDDCYRILEDDGDWYWTDEMIEGLVEEPVLSAPNITEGIFIHEKDMKWTTEYLLPDGYIFKDENGNVINATKIVLEKKKKEYPKTYEECCKILGFLNVDLCFNADYRSFDASKEQWKKLGLMNQFYQLFVCRDAYWKIAGEEMGLGKPWEPDWTIESSKYIILFKETKIEKRVTCKHSRVLAFPTEEMRDAFYEAFRKEIEICKELL